MEEYPHIPLSRAGAIKKWYWEVMATIVTALAEFDRSTFLVIDEAHELAPQRTKCPDAFETLATT